MDQQLTPEEMIGAYPQAMYKTNIVAVMKQYASQQTEKLMGLLKVQFRASVFSYHIKHMDFESAVKATDEDWQSYCKENNINQ